MLGISCKTLCVCSDEYECERANALPTHSTIEYDDDFNDGECVAQQFDDSMSCCVTSTPPQILVFFHYNFFFISSTLTYCIETA